jgi:hypothetical protein
LAIRQRAFLTHHHAGFDAARAADNAGGPTVISFRAELELAKAETCRRFFRRDFFQKV